MTIGRGRSSRRRAAHAVRGALSRRKTRRARAVDGLRDYAHGSRHAGRAARGGAGAVVVYTRRKAAGKRAPLLMSLPLLAGAGVSWFLAVRRLRRGVKNTVPE